MDKEENLSRIKKIQELLTQRRIDALLLFEGEAINYLTNAIPNAVYLTSMRELLCTALLVPQQGQPEVDVLSVDLKKAKQQAWINKVKPYFAFPRSDPMLKMVGSINERGLEKGTIGVEKLFLVASHFEALQQALPHATFVDASGLVSELAASKSELEIGYIEEAQNIAFIGMKAALNAIREGVSELDIAAEAEMVMKKNGSERTSQSTFVASGIERLQLAHPVASKNRIKKDDIISIDLGAVYNGYCSDLSRTAVYGKPTTEQKKAFEAVLEAQNAAIEAARPGVSTNQVAIYVRNVYARYGQKGYIPEFIGHGIGMKRVEVPYIVAGSQYTISENCTLALLETSPFNKRIGQMRLEDVILVTSQGSIILGDQSVPRELICL